MISAHLVYSASLDPVSQLLPIALMFARFPFFSRAAGYHFFVDFAWLWPLRCASPPRTDHMPGGFPEGTLLEVHAPGQNDDDEGL